ncbi:hypothetical protein EW146_g9636, partial [Bondarzewia mesenterica]
PQRSPRPKPATAKLIRSRSTSVSLSPPEPSQQSVDVGLEWFGLSCRFEIAQEQIEIEGYQIYAVEKWVTERSRPVITLTVYTGDPKHRITVTALTPSANSAQDAQLEWDKVIRDLRQAGARPKETEQGTLMVTSLANFRSDFTIVHIPSGFFLEARERLYTNINLLRMGCSGRSALTLEEPSDTTKDRFIAMYHVQDKARSTEVFGTTTLELVKLLQTGLAIFGMFDLSPEERNGLLCDVTVDGIQRWIVEIGERLVGVEPAERVADPTIVSALLSLVASTRNKLYALGFDRAQGLPKDPFLESHAFVQVLNHMQSCRALAACPAIPSPPYFTYDVVRAIETAYSKFRQSEWNKPHRVLLSKLDDFTTDLRTSTATPDGGGPPALGGSASHTIEATTDLNRFVLVVLAGGKESIGSLRYLWTGRLAQLEEKRREKVGSDAEREREEEKNERTDGKSTEDEGEFKGWKSGRRVQKKFESWTSGYVPHPFYLSGHLFKNLMCGVKLEQIEEAERGFFYQEWTWQARTGTRICAWDAVPAAVAAGHHLQASFPWLHIHRPFLFHTHGYREEDEEILSSGQGSPVSQHRYPLGASPLFADTIPHPPSEYDRRVSEFNFKRPMKPANRNRITSWSDPMSARWGSMKDESGLPERSGSGRGSRDNVSVLGDGLVKDDMSVLSLRRRAVGVGLVRRRSFDDASRLTRMRILPLDRMKIDVDLCGQLLIMRRRERHLEGVISTLHVLTNVLSRTNAQLREDYQAHQRALTEVEARTKLIGEIEGARVKADGIMQDTSARSYESGQFRVLAMREKVFGTGRRVPRSAGVGRYDRVQWTLDGEERRVDWVGRTEAEAEEEEGLEPAVEEEEERVLEHQGLFKPTWLLKLFESWGARWGAGRSKKPKSETVPEGGGEASASPLTADAGAQAKANAAAVLSGTEGASDPGRVPPAYHSLNDSDDDS